jgi:hypothetical protein
VQAGSNARYSHTAKAGSIVPTPSAGYFLDGRRIPSVSSVLNNLGWGNEFLVRWAADLGLQGIDYEKERDKAATIGTIAHELIAAHLLKRAPDVDAYPFDLIEAGRPCLRAYQTWAKEHQIELIASEEPLVSSAMRYGGTFDAVVRMNGNLTLLDFKSSNWLYPKMILQATAYLDLIAECKGKHIDKAVILQVTKSGEFKTLTVEGETIVQAREAFYYLLQLHKLKAPLEKLTKAVNRPGAIPTMPEITVMGVPLIRQEIPL